MRAPTLSIRPGHGVTACLTCGCMGTTPSRLMLLASAACIVVAVVALYARSAILDRGHFSDRAVAALAQDEVADEIASRFSTDLIERSPELVTLRPALEAAATEVAMSPEFAAEFGAATRKLHRGVFTGSDPRPALRVPGMTAQVRAAIAAAHARARRAAAAPGPTRRCMSIGGNAARARAARRRARTPVEPTRLAPIAARPRAARAPARRAARARPAPRDVGERARARRSPAARSSPAGRVRGRSRSRASTRAWGDAIVNTIWGAYLGDLRIWSLGLAGAGIVVAAVAARPEHHARLSWSRIPAAAPRRGPARERRARAGRPRPRARPRGGGRSPACCSTSAPASCSRGRARLALAAIAVLALTVGVAVLA